MASASCEIKIGFRSSAEPGTTNSQACVIRFGVAVAAAPTAWAGNEASRSVTDWLPPMETPLLDPRTGRIHPAWYRYLRVLGERIGGIQGATIPQVQASVAATQVQVAANTAYVDQSVAYTASVAASAAATAQVAQENGLSGAGSIPPPSSPPSRPNYMIE